MEGPVPYRLFYRFPKAGRGDTTRLGRLGPNDSKLILRSLAPFLKLCSFVARINFGEVPHEALRSTGADDVSMTLPPYTSRDSAPNYLVAIA
jgi:hypothetical protein